jgi:hypothetical protein
MSLQHLKNKSQSSINNSPNIQKKATKMYNKFMTKVNQKASAQKAVLKKINRPKKSTLKTHKTRSKSKNPSTHPN